MEKNIEVFTFVKGCQPLKKISDADIEYLVHNLEIFYQRRGSELIIDQKAIYLIRSGSVKLLEDDQTHYDLLGAGDWIYPPNIKLEIKFNVVEDCLIYQTSIKSFNKLLSYPIVKHYFSKPKLLVIKNSKQGSISDSVGELAKLNKTYTVDKSMSIRQVAHVMAEKQITGAMVMDGDNLCGIVTDRAFCTEVVAKEIDYSASIQRIMTPEPITISNKAQPSEAIMLMSKHHIRHLPVTKKGKVIGLVTASDLIRKQSHNSLLLINQIRIAETAEDLIKPSQQIPMVLVELMNRFSNVYDLGYFISSIGKAINQQLITIAEAKYGKPPVAYTWVVAGSMARNEQTVHTDQDNMIILSDDYDAVKHRAYFVKLSKFVCDGLDKCGYVYCPGDLMATNSKWMQPYSVWEKYFEKWISKPDKKSLLYSSIFFDMKAIYGEDSLLTNLQNHVLILAKSNTIFLSYMANNALLNQPPLGLFKGFILEREGQQANALNMKKRGVVPIIDLARVYALSYGISAVSTQYRIQELIEVGGLSKQNGSDLLGVYEFITLVRLKHQKKQIEKSETVNNYVLPEEISSFDCKHLKDAFKIVMDLQKLAHFKYHLEVL